MIETGLVERKHAQYAYRAVGRGAPLFFLHGLFGSPRLFDAQMLALADRFRCVSIALPPHAGSHILDEELAIDQIAEDVVAIVRNFDRSPATLVGNSMGGAVALRAALRDPDAFGSLVVIASHGGVLDPSFGNGIRQLAQAGAGIRRGAIAQIVSGMYPADWIAANKVEFDRQVDEAAAITPEQLDRLGTILLSYNDVSSQLADLRIPTLLLWGEQDGIVAPDIAPSIATGFRSAQLRMIPGAGHQPQVDQHNAVTKALVTFLDAL